MFNSPDHTNAEESEQSVELTASEYCRLDTDGDL